MTKIFQFCDKWDFPPKQEIQVFGVRNILDFVFEMNTFIQKGHNNMI